MLSHLFLFFGSSGVPVDEVLRTGWTPLMYAGNFANVNAMKFLLERGADPNYHTGQQIFCHAPIFNT